MAMMQSSNISILSNIYTYICLYICIHVDVCVYNSDKNRYSRYSIMLCAKLEN